VEDHIVAYLHSRGEDAGAIARRLQRREAAVRVRLRSLDLD
jgi:hypothetical protein